MKCPDCGHVFSRVLRSKDRGEEVITRRRECRRCGHRWTTFETFEMPDLEAAFRIQEALSILDAARTKLILALAEWRTPNLIEPKGLRQTVPSEAQVGGWAGYAVERFIGHSPGTVTGLHYALEDQDLFCLMRDQVVNRIDRETIRLAEKWHEKRAQQKRCAFKGIAVSG